MTTSEGREATIQSIKKSRSPLRTGLDYEQFSDAELRKIDSFLSLAEPHHRRVKKTITWLFMFAGFLWIPLFFPGLTSLSEAELVVFKSNQLRLYVILLSLWGYIKHRRMKQVTMILQISTQLGKPWFELTREDLVAAEALSTCEGFTRLEGSDKRYLHIFLAWFFSVLGVGQLLRQSWLLFG